MDHLSMNELVLLVAAQQDKITATRAGFAVAGRMFGPDTQQVVGLLLIDDYLDVDMALLDTPQPVTLTVKGEQALARHEQESRR